MDAVAKTYIFCDISTKGNEYIHTQLVGSHRQQNELHLRDRVGYLRLC